MKPLKTLPGINIQYPISESILRGKKTIETRFYPLPTKYVGVPMAFIETPGRNGSFKARVVAIITFGIPFQYKNSDKFYKDLKHHLVNKDSKWAWQSGRKKWGWPIVEIKKLDSPAKCPLKKGIRFTKDVKI